MLRSPALLALAILLVGSFALATGPVAPSFGAPATIPGAHPEPSLAVGAGDQLYVAAPTGVDVDTGLLGDGVTLAWRSTGAGYHDISPPPFVAGGGDSDVLVAPDGTIYIVDLWAGSISSWTSHDGGSTWSGPFPVASGTLANDRMWLAADETGAVYLVYNQLETGYWVSKTTDHGATWLPTKAVGVGDYPPGPLRYANGELFFAHSEPVWSALSGVLVGHVDAGPVQIGPAVYVTTSKDHGATWTDHRVAQLAEWSQNQFPSVASDADGTLYVAWAEGILSDHRPIKYAYSTDGGDSWSAPITLVDPGAGSMTLPSAVAGGSGHLGVAYIRSDRANSDTSAQWHVEYAFTTNAKTPTPTVTTSTVSDRVIYKGAITGRPSFEISDFLTAKTLSTGNVAITWSEAAPQQVRVAIQSAGSTI